MAGDQRGPVAFLRRQRTAVLKDDADLDGTSSKLEIIHTPENPTVDVVAVHGLARGFKSWTWGDSSLRRVPNWLEAGLAKDECGKQMRIMTYSYEPDLFKAHAQVRTVLYGRAHDLVHQLVRLRKADKTSDRPMVFIAHSLGGLIVKRALIYSNDSIDADLRRIEVLTGGVAYLGTPDDDVKPKMLADIIRKVSLLSSRLSGWLSGNETQLTNDAAWLENELGSYKPIRSELKVLSFYEMKKTSFRGQRELVVPGPTTSSRVDDATRVNLQRKHTGLVKFHGDDDPTYIQFIKFFRILLIDASRRAAVKLERHGSALTLLNDNTNTYLENDFGIVSNLPMDISRTCPQTVVRTSLISRIQQMFEEPRDVKDFNIVTVYGPPGVGKTTVVRDYCEEAMETATFVFWINAESRATVITGYLELLMAIVDYYAEKHYARQLPKPSEARAKVERDMGVPSIQAMLEKKSVTQLEPVEIQSAIKGAKDWLLRDGNRWLLVFDNVLPSYNLLEFIPLSRQGKLILLSEDRTYCPWGDALEVPAWTEDDAVELFEKLMERPNPIHGHPPSPEKAGFLSKPLKLFDDIRDLSGDISRKIVRQLGCQPLAISSAAKYMQATQETPDHYLSLLEYPGRFLGALHSTLTIKVLEVCSMLSSEAVPFSLLQKVAEWYSYEDGGRPKSSAAAGSHTRDRTNSNERADTLIGILETLVYQSVILRVTDPDSSSEAGGPRDSYLLHNSAKTWIKDRWMENRQAELRSAWMACFCCVRLIRHHSSASIVRNAHSSERMIVPHARACYKMSDLINEESNRLLKDAKEHSIIEWQVLGGLFMRQGLQEEASKCFDLALSNAGRMEVREQIETRLSLATLHQQLGNPTACRNQLNQINTDSLPEQDRALGRRVKLARAMAAVAEKQLEAAVRYYDSLDKAQELDLGPTDTRTIFTVHRLGATLKHLGKLESAEANYRQALVSYRIVLGPNNSVTLDAAEELAHILQLRGLFAKAQELFEWTIKVKKQTLGASHPSTAVSVAKLAALYDVMGNFLDADIQYAEAFDIMERALGTSHPLYLAAKENHALSYRKRAQQLFVREQQCLAGAIAAVAGVGGGGEGLEDKRDENHDDRDDTKKEGTRAMPAPPPMVAVAAATAAAAAATATSTTGTTTLTGMVKATAAPPSPSPRAARSTVDKYARHYQRAEAILFDVIGTKEGNPNLYSEEQVRATRLKLAKMYETEQYFRDRTRILRIEYLREESSRSRVDMAQDSARATHSGAQCIL